jgi:hypothetical protein
MPKKRKKAFKPAPGPDPSLRWVPPDNLGENANQWSRNIYHAGDTFNKNTGLNPSGPIADNIAETLQAQGRRGRVMQTTYRNVRGAGKKDEIFTHYIAVELDESGKIIRYYDPGNGHLFKQGLNGLEEVVPGGQLPEYWPTIGDDIDLKRMEPRIFKKGEWARDTHKSYGMDEHEYFYDKMMDPVALRKAEQVAAAKAAEVAAEKAAKELAEEALLAPGTKEAQVGFKPWAPAKTKAAAKKQLQDILDECNRRDTYVRVRWGTDEGAHYIRFRHDPTHWKWRDRVKPYSWKAEKLHAKLKISAKTSLEELNAINRKLHELQTRLSLYEIPPLRGAFTWAQQSGWAANMGDGVMGLHHDAFGSWFGDLIFDRAKYADNLKKVVDQQRELLKTVGLIEGKKSKAYRAIKEQVDQRTKELKRLAEDTWEGPLYGNRRSKASTWRPGDDTIDRPENVRDYFSNYADKGYKTMEHELGHHIHQQMFVDGNTGIYDDPPFEKWLDYFFSTNPATRNNIRSMAPSRYALKNPHEWFAENYCSWQMGAKHLVNEELVGVLEGLDDLASGKITYRQLKYKMFDGGDFARPILPAGKRVYKEAAEAAEYIDEVYYQTLRALRAQEGRVNPFELHDVLYKEFEFTTWTTDVEKALEKALKEGLVSKTPQGWLWGAEAKLGTLPSKYVLPGTLPVPPAPEFQKAVLNMWDTMVHRSLTAETTTMEYLIKELDVKPHVAKIFVNDLKKHKLVVQIGGEGPINNTTEFFIKDPNTYNR